MGFLNNLKHRVMMQFNSEYAKNNTMKDLQDEIDALKIHAVQINSASLPPSVSSRMEQAAYLDSRNNEDKGRKHERRQNNASGTTSQSYLSANVTSLSNTFQSGERCVEPPSSIDNSSSSYSSLSSDSGGSSSCD